MESTRPLLLFYFHQFDLCVFDCYFFYLCLSFLFIILLVIIVMNLIVTILLELNDKVRDTAQQRWCQIQANYLEECEQEEKEEQVTGEQMIVEQANLHIIHPGLLTCPAHSFTPYNKQQ